MLLDVGCRGGVQATEKSIYYTCEGLLNSASCPRESMGVGKGRKVRLGKEVGDTTLDSNLGRHVGAGLLFAAPPDASDGMNRIGVGAAKGKSRYTKREGGGRMGQG